MSILLSYEEIEALHELDAFLYKLYIHAIRRYMDSKTGIVGIKRRISYMSLREEMYIPPASGVKKILTGLPDKWDIQRGVDRLIKRGLLDQVGEKKNLIFRCVLAPQDKSVQKQGATRLLRQDATEVATSAHHENPYRMPIIEEKFSQDDTQGATRLLRQDATPLLSSKDKDKSIKAYVHSDSRFDDFWKIYPRKENKKKSYVIWERNKLDTKAALIINDVILRIEKHAPWKNKKFIPHATTYLNGERWDDEIRDSQDDGYQQRPRQNSMSRAIDNILNSPTRAKAG